MITLIAISVITEINPRRMRYRPTTDSSSGCTRRSPIRGCRAATLHRTSPRHPRVNAVQILPRIQDPRVVAVSRDMSREATLPRVHGKTRVSYVSRNRNVKAGFPTRYPNPAETPVIVVPNAQTGTIDCTPVIGMRNREHKSPFNLLLRGCAAPHVRWTRGVLPGATGESIARPRDHGCHGAGGRGRRCIRHTRQRPG